MNRLMFLATVLMVALFSSPVLAQHEGAARGEAHATEIIPVPQNTGWVYRLALGFMWIFIAAIILGPIALWIRGPERPETVSHASSAHATH